MSTSLRFDFLEGKNTANPAMRKAAAEATAMSTAIRVASVAATAGAVGLGAAVVSAAAHVVALGQSAIIASQSVLLLPAALAAAVGTAIAGKLAFGGLGEAWKATGAAAISGGGAAADIAHRVEVANRGVRDATQGLADAQREALDAQSALTRARENAAERLEDLSRSVRGARLDERSATLAVKEARDRLAQARRDRNADDITRAKIAYEQAQLSLESVKDTVEDLGKEQAEASAKGVEGSDEVVSATLRQEQAQRQLIHATERLADAQRELAQSGKSGGGGAMDKANQALARLAPNAAAVVTTLRAMGPAWSAASKNAQQATWAGVAGDFNNLGSIYLPRVDGWARRMGEAFNVAIRSTLGLAQTDGFARNVGTTLENIDQTVLRLGRSLAPFVNGFMAIVTVGSSFLPGIATNVGSIAERFERWALAAQQSGQMQQWIATGIATLGQFWAVARDVVMTVVAIFKAGENTGTLDALVNGAAAMRAWAESAGGQAQIAVTLSLLRDIFTDLVTVVPIFVAHAGLLSDTMSVFGVFIAFAADHLGLLAAVLPTLITLFIAYKTIQMGVNIVTLNGTVLKVAEIVATTRHTAALNRNTASMALGETVQKRSLITMAAARVATITQTAVQWLLAASTWAVLGPILLVIAAIALLVVVIVLIIKYHKEIGAFFVMVWGHIWDFLKMIGAWFAGPFVNFFVDAWNYIVGRFNKGVDWIMGWVNRFLAPILAIKEKIQAVGIWQTLIDGFKAAVNILIGLWNKLDFEIGPISIPSWVPPPFGGKSLHIKDAIPDIPLLDIGGSITATGMAVVHRGEEVVPAAEVTSRRQNGGGTQRVEHVLRSDGSAMSDWILEQVRKAVGDRGGDVQFVIGR